MTAIFLGLVSVPPNPEVTLIPVLEVCMSVYSKAYIELKFYSTLDASRGTLEIWRGSQPSSFNFSFKIRYLFILKSATESFYGTLMFRVRNLTKYGDLFIICYCSI